MQLNKLNYYRAEETLTFYQVKGLIRRIRKLLLIPSNFFNLLSFPFIEKLVKRKENVLINIAIVLPSLLSICKIDNDNR